MIKKIILFVLMLSFTNFFAQTEEEAYDILANETCECVNKNGIGKTKEEIQTQLGLCMMKSFGENKDKFDKAGLNLKMNDYESGRALGKKIGIKMAIICPEVFMAFMDDKSVEKHINSTDKVNSVSGTIKSISDGDISYITILDSNNIKQKFIWLRNFEGSDKIIENKKTIIGKKVIIKFVNTECYIPKMKEYFMQKEITKMEFID